MFLRIATLSLWLVFGASHVMAQFEKKNLEAFHFEEAPAINGVLDDPCWKDAPIADGFIMDNPFPGKPLEQKTEVKVVYNHEAIFIGFFCYDTAPDSILSQLSGRDVSGNTDYCGVTFSCYQDGLNGLSFLVNVKGEQYDARNTGDYEDLSWNAVWYVKTKKNDKGWVAEFKIPFAALRFPEKEEQTWNINFVREVRRTRHHAYWNGVNPVVPGYLTQMGTLSGLKNLKPPKRIFFYPYTSGYYNTAENGAGKTDGAFSYNLGLDLKLGLSDAFTLDATLIPDYGQTISDQQILNLSAYEVQFSENRQFFIEGTELFSRSGIFYSRRIGFDSPIRFNDAYALADSNEVVTDNPMKDHVVNAIKISGRDKNKLGIGFFNAVTSPTNATVRDTMTGVEREINTSPLTNYNVFVLDQVLPHNSYFSVINTSVLRNGSDYDVNVIGTEFEFRDKKNKYSLSGSGALNTKFGRQFSLADDRSDQGYRESVQISKINGNFTYSLGQYIESDTYDPTDMGFLQANNEVGFFTSQSYNIYEPFGRFNNMWLNLWLYYYRMYKPSVYTNFSIESDGGFNTRKFNTWGYDLAIQPYRGYDYFEPRVWGRYFQTYRFGRLGVWFSSDYRKKIAIDLSVYGAQYENKNRYMFNWRVAPRFRINDHLFITYVYSYQSMINDIGFAYAFEDDGASPLFGTRDVISHTNVLNLKYAFNPYMNVNTRLRHYWGYTRFHHFHHLENDGSLSASESTAENQNFNTFTVDMIYNWIITPGSELSFVWKRAMTGFNNHVPNGLIDDIQTVGDIPQVNSYSIKLIYFVDYHRVSDALTGRSKRAE
ncbi:MAG: carbohydrate binding family 9 domain-containing protein [Flavobacteriales bacterium]|nr:carbohydrate binding family 9 domain-containing protein [Flavobacteriales bacterium]